MRKKDSTIIPNGINMGSPILKTLFLGNIMAQSNEAMNLWEGVLNNVKPKRILEIGTYKGNLSLFFALYCYEKLAEFRTYDIRPWLRYEKRSSPLKEKFLDAYTFLKDVFVDREEIKRFIRRDGQTVVFCDGGNKKREFALFSEYLKVGDIIAFHDWMTEVLPENVEPVVVKHNLKPVFTAESEKEGHTCFFQKNG